MRTLNFYVAELHVRLPAQISPSTTELLISATEQAFQTVAIAGSLDAVVKDADRLAEVIVGLAQPKSQLMEERIRRLQTIREIIDHGDWLTAEELNALQLSPPSNKSLPASDWKRRGRIFGVVNGGREYFARYQFGESYEPLDIVRDLLKVFGEVADPWSLAAWFHFPNGWLVDEDGIAQSPKNMLNHREMVLTAASKRDSYVA